VTEPLPPVSMKLRPTGRGAFLLAASCASLLAAWLGGGLGFGVLATFGLATCLVTALATWRRAASLRVAAPAPTTAFAGERLFLDVDVANLAAGARAFDVIVSTDAARPGRPLVGAFLPRLDAGATKRVPVLVGSLHRGLHPQGTIELASTFPAALFSCTLSFALPEVILVLPRLGTLRKKSRRERPARRTTGHGGVGRGDEQETYGLRAWRDGEGLRSVHWRLSARRGRLLVREFRSDPRPPVHVVFETALDEDSRRRRGQFEDAVSLAATLVDHHARLGHTVRLTIAGKTRRTVACRRDRGAIVPVLRALALVDPEFGADARTAGLIARGRGRETTIVVRVASTKDAAPRRAESVFEVGDGDVASYFDRRRRPSRELLTGARP